MSEEPEGGVGRGVAGCEKVALCTPTHTHHPAWPCHTLRRRDGGWMGNAVPYSTTLLDPCHVGSWSKRFAACVLSIVDCDRLPYPLPNEKCGHARKQLKLTIGRRHTPCHRRLGHQGKTVGMEGTSLRKEGKGRQRATLYRRQACPPPTLPAHPAAGTAAGVRALCYG